MISQDTYISRLFSGRITRVNYLFGNIFLSTGVWILAVVLFSATLSFSEIASFLLYIFSIALIIFYNISFAVRRFHDIGRSAYNLLWLLVPFVSLYFYVVLLFKSGERKTNKYGEDPERKLCIQNLLGILPKR